MVQELRLVSPRADRPSSRRGHLDAAGDGARSGWQLTDGSARSALLEVLSREVRATLALVSGYSQTLLHLDMDDEGRGRYLARISIASQHVAELTEAMLSVTVSQDDGRPFCQAVAMGNLISLLDREFEEEADPPQLISRLPADLPLVNADPVWIGCVLRNLVTTIAGGSADGRAVLVDARSTGDWVVVCVQPCLESIGTQTSDADSPKASVAATTRREGPLSHRFDLPTTSLVEESARSGLDLCRQLVEAHGGRIWLDEVASGVRLSFSLPRHRSVSIPA
jgi:signal transduction histidine kinase